VDGHQHGLAPWYASRPDESRKQLTKPERNPPRRLDAARNRQRILEAADRLLGQSPAATVADIAAAAGVARSTLYRHFSTRDELVVAVEELPRDEDARSEEAALPAGRLGRARPVQLEAIAAFDAVSPHVLPEQLVAEAQRIAGVPLALYVLDIDGSHLLRVAGTSRVPERLKAPLAVGPELDADGLAALREMLRELPGVHPVPLWLRGRATGLLIAIDQPQRPLADLARHAAAAINLADQYTDVFARAKRRKQPKAAAEIQQSLLPPRISRVSGGEVAGNVIPSYEVAGDWFDVVENADGVWLSLADGLGSGTRSTASAAVALGALRASRRSGAVPSEALMVMHRTLREMPGPHLEMTALIALWDTTRRQITVTDCGHIRPILIRADGRAEQLEMPRGRGLGGRATPRPRELSLALETGDRFVLLSNGVLKQKGETLLSVSDVTEACLSSEWATAADTVRKVHDAVLERSDADLSDDATVVCLAVS
jgi:serine phosphatase RsbU (regulator of sigma subunit)